MEVPSLPVGPGARLWLRVSHAHARFSFSRGCVSALVQAGYYVACDTTLAFPLKTKKPSCGFAVPARQLGHLQLLTFVVIQVNYFNCRKFFFLSLITSTEEIHRNVVQTGGKSVSLRIGQPGRYRAV